MAISIDNLIPEGYVDFLYYMVSELLKMVSLR